MNSLVGFVILHYRDRAVTDLCVQSILKMKDKECCRIIVVDNDVHRDTEERKILTDMYHDVENLHVIQIMEDKGFSYANNRGYEYARQIGCEYIVVCNNDIEFQQPDFISRIKEDYETYGYGILGPDVIHSKTGEHQNPIDRRIRTEKEVNNTIRLNKTALKYYELCYPLLLLWDSWNDKNRRKNKNADKLYYETLQVDSIPFGACLIYSPSYVKERDKAFWPETRFYYEEYILGYQCQKYGYRTVYDPKIKVFHETGAATKKTFRDKKKRMKFLLEQTLHSCNIYLDLIQKDR